MSRFSDHKDIIIYSDGCSNQNRNAILATALLDYCIRQNVVVIQKYLENGHTQMEVGSIHSCIESKLKGRDIYLPTDYINICETSRIKPKPYEVAYMQHDYFKNFAATTMNRCSNLRPGNKVGDPHVTDLRQIKYCPNGEIFFKLEHNSEWSPLPRKATQKAPQDFPLLYNNRQKISQRKFKDLQDLLAVIPVEAHPYYANLPHRTICKLFQYYSKKYFVTA